MSGRRLDLDQRPELMYGSVDWLATAEYCARTPTPVSYLFAIDVSAASVASGMLASVSGYIKDTISGGLLEDGVQVGVMTYDAIGVQFYNLTAGLEQPQMMVVTDVDEVFSPLHKGLFVDPGASRYTSIGSNVCACVCVQGRD